ncbi:FmdB family zinc ribbon protein [Streptomyces sp. NPDC005774]|uniref:FmdB family zinc ribbon protein n=1 Tax=Streptomyces sp. NPDC005774 TaxID=3364728 RepID=UPI00367D964A
MTTYGYSCHRCGNFDVRLPIGTAPVEYVCPDCAAVARRVYSSPALSVPSKLLKGLHEQEEQSRESPSVVSGPPPTRCGSASVHPAIASLPRP